jgi:hypothetical protein
MKGSLVKSSNTNASKKRSRDDAGDADQSSSSPPSSPLPNPTKEWKKVMLKTEDLLTLVNSGFLREKEMDLWRTAELERYASSRRR